MSQKNSDLQAPSEVRHALDAGLKAGQTGNLSFPEFESQEERMAFRVGWMEARKQELSDQGKNNEAHQQV